MKKRTEELKKQLKEKRTSLENTKTFLTENPNVMEDTKVNKYLTFTTTTIESVDQCFEMKSGGPDDVNKTLDTTSKEILDEMEKESEESKSLENIMKQLVSIPEESKPLDL